MTVSPLPSPPVHLDVFAAADAALSNLGLGENDVDEEQLNAILTAALGALLTDDDRAALDLAAQLAGACRRLCGDGPLMAWDWAEFATLLHGIQARILANVARRAFPQEFRPLGGDPE